ncbi:hypothetical protein KIS4809_3895 [Bacillus sp. ZZV12-4809]|nr:hypothetical protein KIS4809_3895 [Bacillus sp. ZZV12-4809]
MIVFGGTAWGPCFFWACAGMVDSIVRFHECFMVPRFLLFAPLFGFMNASW